MDDDDFYPENSFAQRVTAILNGYDCVGCGITIAYNLLRNTCLPIGSEYGIAEATFAYTKRFWQR